MLLARDAGKPPDPSVFADRVRTAVAECVDKQARSGIDVVSDGELGKPNFVRYVTDRIGGMEGWDDGLYINTDPEFPGYDAWLASRWPEFRDKPLAEFKKVAGLWVEALNHALKGVPEDRVRMHVCWGNNEAPHTRDAPLRDLIDLVLSVNVGAYSVEAANPRHEHEWKLWQDVKLPDGKVLIPGVIDNTTNFVEHPALVAERIVRFARVVGRENLIAGVACVFGTSAGSEQGYPPVVCGKLK